MANELAQALRERDTARAHLKKVEDELAKYESHEHWEQRDLARQEYEHEYLKSVALNNKFWTKLAEVAEPKGEAWLFAVDVMERDRELAKQYPSVASDPAAQDARTEA